MRPGNAAEGAMETPAWKPQDTGTVSHCICGFVMEETKGEFSCSESLYGKPRNESCMNVVESYLPKVKQKSNTKLLLYTKLTHWQNRNYCLRVQRCDKTVKLSKENTTVKAKRVFSWGA